MEKVIHNKEDVKLGLSPCGNAEVSKDVYETWTTGPWSTRVVPFHVPSMDKDCPWKWDLRCMFYIRLVCLYQYSGEINKHYLQSLNMFKFCLED